MLIIVLDIPEKMAGQKLTNAQKCKIIYLSVAPVIFTFVAILLIFAPIRKLTQHY